LRPSATGSIRTGSSGRMSKPPSSQLWLFICAAPATALVRRLVRESGFSGWTLRDATSNGNLIKTGMMRGHVRDELAVLFDLRQ
jgi:hypothetical protein